MTGQAAPARRFSARMPLTAPEIPVIPRVPCPIVSEWASLDAEARVAAERRLRAAAMPIREYHGDGSVTVTFVHDDSEASAVILSANSLLDHEKVGSSEFERLDASDLWVISYRVPRNWTASYVITPHRGDGSPPWRSESERRAIRLAADAGVADPRNPSVSVQMDGRPVSIVEPPSGFPGVQRSRPDGRLPRELTFADDPIRRRTVWLYEPETRGVDVPLLLLFDGQVWARHLSMVRLFDDAIASGVIPPIAVAMLDSMDIETRWDDLGCAGGANDFILDTLLPWLRANCPIRADAESTVVSGASFGGLSALWLVARAPEQFGLAIAQSPSLWREESERLAGAPALPEMLCAVTEVRLEIQAGVFEPEIHRAAEALHGSLRGAGVDAAFSSFDGGHDWAWWVPGVIAGLGRMLGASRE